MAINRNQKAATAILAARARNPPYGVVLYETTDEEAEVRRKQAQFEHPLQGIDIIRVEYEGPAIRAGRLTITPPRANHE